MIQMTAGIVVRGSYTAVFLDWLYCVVVYEFCPSKAWYVA